jgi:hypothetical protein
VGSVVGVVAPQARGERRFPRSTVDQVQRGPGKETTDAAATLSYISVLGTKENQYNAAAGAWLNRKTERLRQARKT